MSRVVVFGEMLVDQFASGPVVGGAPFNVARHLAALGLAPLMISAIGDDAPGQRLEAELARHGLRDVGVQRRGDLPTGVVDVTLSDDGHRFHILEHVAWDAIEGDQALAAMRDGEGPTSPCWLYHGTLALRAPVSRSAARRLIQHAPDRRFVDLNWRAGQLDSDIALEVARGARVLKVNDAELELVCAWLQVHPRGLEAQARVAQAALGVPLLLVTRGELGAVAFDARGEVLAEAPAPPVTRMIDTVGAGDAFSAVMLAGLARGWPLPICLRRATALASRICEVRGAVPESLDAYARWTSDWTD
jgi:fructokinase